MDWFDSIKVIIIVYMGKFFLTATLVTIPYYNLFAVCAGQNCF